MKRRTLVQTCAPWVCAALAAYIFLLTCAAFDTSPNDAQSSADALSDAKATAELLARRDHLAARICAAELGPGTQVIWTVGGDLVCRPARIVAEGGAL